MVRASDRVRAAAHVLRLCAAGKVELDAETISALVQRLDSATLDIDQLEARVVVRPARRSSREDSLVALVYCAIELMDPFFAASMHRALHRLLSGSGEVLS